MTLKRGRENHRWLQGRRYQLGNEKQPGFVCFGFLRILEFAVGQQRVAGEQIFSQLWEIFTHLPEKCEYVWEIFTHLWEMWLSLNVTALNLIKPLTIKACYSPGWAHRYSSFIILCWEQHEWEMPCHLFHDYWSKSFKVGLWPQKIRCGFWGRKARKVRSHLMYYWRWSLQNHICLPSYRNSNKVVTAHKHDSCWLEDDPFSTQQPNGVLA